MRELLDTIRPRPTPEGCELDLQVVGPMSRALTWETSGPEQLVR